MARPIPIKNRRKDRKIFARTAKRMHKKNLIIENDRGGTRM